MRLYTHPFDGLPVEGEDAEMSRAEFAETRHDYEAETVEYPSGSTREIYRCTVCNHVDTHRSLDECSVRRERYDATGEQASTDADADSASEEVES
jgi:hypothetical protein